MGQDSYDQGLGGDFLRRSEGTHSSLLLAWLLVDCPDDATNSRAALSLVKYVACIWFLVKDGVISNSSLHTSVSIRCPASGP